jgi:integrase/recombinase XerD
MSWPTRSRVATDALQHRSPCVGDDGPPEDSSSLWNQELCAVQRQGAKERAVPLWSSTSRTLRTWFEELDSDARYRAATAFPNARGTALSRDGVDYILQHAVQRSAAACPSLANKHVTPHLVRHTSAMHLLQAGVDITVIALWLGHESTQTTHGYIEADLALKEIALKKVGPAGQKTKRFQPDDELLRFLTSL